MSHTVATPAALPTVRAQPPVPCCDRRSHGLHAASAEALDDTFTTFLNHPARITRTPAVRRLTLPPSHAHTLMCVGGCDFFTKEPVPI
jgi:hypothetical protein